MQLTRLVYAIAFASATVANPAPVVAKRAGLIVGTNAEGLKTVTIAAECNVLGKLHLSELSIY